MKFVLMPSLSRNYYFHSIGGDVSPLRPRKSIVSNQNQKQPDTYTRIEPTISLWMLLSAQSITHVSIVINYRKVGTEVCTGK